MFNFVKKIKINILILSIVLSVLLLCFFPQSDAFEFGFPFSVVKFNFTSIPQDLGYTNIFDMFSVSYQNITLYIWNFIGNIFILYYFIYKSNFILKKIYSSKS